MQYSAGGNELGIELHHDNLQTHKQPSTWRAGACALASSAMMAIVRLYAFLLVVGMNSKSCLTTTNFKNTSNLQLGAQVLVHSHHQR